MLIKVLNLSWFNLWLYFEFLIFLNGNFGNDVYFELINVIFVLIWVVIFLVCFGLEEKIVFFKL